MDNLIVKIAENDAEIESAQRLRYEVFNLECGRGLAASGYSGLDRDEYDSLCHHLIVFDCAAGMVVGPYRFLLRSRLRDGEVFYAEHEFDLVAIRKLKGEILEISRSCVHRDYRRGDTLYMLWEGLAGYLIRHHVDYLIGCPSIEQIDPQQVGEIYALLMRDYGAAEEFRVAPLPVNRIPGLTAKFPPREQERKMIRALPPLIRGYLHAGMRVCGEPAWDPKFGTVDFFCMLPLARIPQSYVSHYRP
ncbi:MAG TPA: GNAT family N-acyltransferase [Desulfobacterales bacterium]|nr:GNAT family N-acyltransferase [Desulfobacterales bacterium]